MTEDDDANVLYWERRAKNAEAALDRLRTEGKVSVNDVRQALGMDALSPTQETDPEPIGEPGVDWVDADHPCTRCGQIAPHTHDLRPTQDTDHVAAPLYTGFTVRHDD